MYILFLSLLFSLSSFVYTCDETKKPVLTDGTILSLECHGFNDETLNTRLSLIKTYPVGYAHLSEIDFSNGVIQVFCLGNWLAALPQLKKLNLAHNQISSIGNISVVGQPAWSSKSLCELDLSHNQLTHFDFVIFNCAPNLTKADFSHNKIAELTIFSVIRDDQIVVNNKQQCTLMLQNNQISDCHKNCLAFVKFNGEIKI